VPLAGDGRTLRRRAEESIVKRAVLIVLALAAVVVPAAPAAAHGQGGSDATNFQSRITDRPHEELRWRVIAGDALLELENRSGREVLIEGYQGEPYLRFDARGGVFENRRSPTTYLNRDRYGAVELPADADAEAEPDWEQVAGGSRYAWHDHRIHWMAQEDPPPVQARPGETVEVQRWTVPYELDGERAELAGVLRYVPAPPWWPWVLGAVLLLGAPALLVVAVARDRLSVRRIARAGAVILLVVTIADVVHQVDDLVAVPATTAEHVRAGAFGAIFIVAGLVSAVVAWRARRSAFSLVFGGLMLMFGFGISHLGALTSSQLASELPDAFTRAVVAANLALAVPVAILVVTAERRFPAQRPVRGAPATA
jgi:hypothetical protein